MDEGIDGTKTVNRFWGGVVKGEITYHACHRVFFVFF